MACWLVRGCDVWINLPRPPLEASGTSGMKNVFNGGLQLSVLDGWWAEGYDGGNGWALSGDVDRPGAQDAATPTSSSACSRKRSRPTSTGPVRTASRVTGSRASAARCARSGRSSAPGGCSRTTRRRSTPAARASGSRRPGSTPIGERIVSRRGRRRGRGPVALRRRRGLGRRRRERRRRRRDRGGATLRGAGVELAPDVLLEAVQARVELLGDVLDALVEPILRDPPGDQEHDGHAHEHADRGTRQHPRRYSAAAAEPPLAVGAPRAGRPRDTRTLGTDALWRRAG